MVPIGDPVMHTLVKGGPGRVWIWCLQTGRQAGRLVQGVVGGSRRILKFGWCRPG